MGRGWGLSWACQSDLQQSIGYRQGVERGRGRCSLFQASRCQDSCLVTHQVILVTSRLSHRSSRTWQCLIAVRMEQPGEETYHHTDIAVHGDPGWACFTLAQVEQPCALASQATASNGPGRQARALLGALGQMWSASQCRWEVVTWCSPGVRSLWYRGWPLCEGPVTC